MSASNNIAIYERLYPGNLIANTTLYFPSSRTRAVATVAEELKSESFFISYVF